MVVIMWRFMFRCWWRIVRGRCWACNQPRSRPSIAGTRYDRWPNQHACRDCNKAYAHGAGYGMSLARAAENLDEGDLVRLRDDGQVERAK